MLFFFWSSDAPGYVPLGLLALSFVLQSGWLPPLAFWWGNDAARRQAEAEQSGVSGTAQLLCIGVAMAASYFICKFLLQFRRQVGQDGLRATLGRLRRTPLRQWPTMWDAPPQQQAAAQQGGQAGRAPASGGRPQSHQARFAAVSKRVQQLPTQAFMSQADLERLPLHDLKVWLREMGLRLRRGESLDRCEAIRLAMERGGSSSLSCSICCEDYESGDVLRRLPSCGHRFHLECIDRWLLTSTDYSQRPASCPICKCEL